MPTLDALVDEVSGHLRAYSVDQESKSYLSEFVDGAATEFTVVHPDRMAAGLVEVDEELVEVSQVDTINGVVSLFPWGRGQQGTVAVPHAGGARVTVSPRWPRARIKRTLNEVIASLYPDLWAVRTSTVPVEALSDEVGLPADVRRILSLSYNGPYGDEDVWGWMVNPSAAVTDFPTGVSVRIPGGVGYASNVRAVYAAEPSPLVNGSDDFATVTGLHDGCSDLVCIGAAARLVTASELAGTQTFTVEHSQRLEGRSPGAAVAASRYLLQLYQIRLQAERTRLFERYPLRVRRMW